MMLQSLIQGLGLTHAAGPGDVTITSITDDSRQVEPGALFLARSAAKDLQSHVTQAIERGAAAIISTAGQIVEAHNTAHYHADRVDQRLAGTLAERFHGNPAHKLSLVGVTGTNGKTTIALLTQHLLQSAGIRTGVIGTIHVDDGTATGRRTAHLTTPGAIEFSRELARMVDAGCKAVTTEVSSHALDQGRAAALRFRAAVFTNLTQDHLDYHQTMEAYAKAKSILFTLLTPGGTAVVNIDDAYAKEVLADYVGPVLWTSLSPTDVKADQPVCYAREIELRADSSSARFIGPWGDIHVTLPLVGKHNVCNTLQAIAATYTITGKINLLMNALEMIPQVPGRLERVKPQATQGAAAEPPTVLVDYAHTPDALENAMSALRPLTPGRLIVMFGCGGDRDKTKRPKMAQAACRYADRIYLTSDNPRTEDPNAIIKDALPGIPEDRKPDLVVQPDRGAAIRASVLEGVAGDTVLLAGKGHEDYQTIGRENIHFDDREHAGEALAEWFTQKAVL
ncbi:MAG: UDP-N-acetylmuramoyl-L-alanyl-D-glutamate--2,6-diaminopimelate ligase [Phycisphaerales bacterium]